MQFDASTADLQNKNRSMTSPNRATYARMQEPTSFRMSEYESADYMGTHHEIELTDIDTIEDDDDKRYTV
jgi:hypothetical protein